MQYYSKEVGLRIKNLRRQRNMTQMELAEKLCYATERQLQRIENGEAICPVDRIVELAGILNTSTDYILMGHENAGTLGGESLWCKSVKGLILIMTDGTL